jgi:tRNA(His) guanylyltransferase
MKDSLGDRMKENYENAYRISLPMRMPVIIRCDGKAFSSYTAECKKPFDPSVIAAMGHVAMELCKAIQGAQVAYLQSDEITILVVNYATFDTEAWFGNNLQKVVSVAAGIASSVMTEASVSIFGKVKRAVFDARAFVLPKEEVCNAFLWRQQDASRNSVQMLARSLYSHSQCNNKINAELQEMIFKKGENWDKLPTTLKRGCCVVKKPATKEVVNPKTHEKIIIDRPEWVVDNEIPIFSQDRSYIDRFVYVDEEEKIMAE